MGRFLLPTFLVKCIPFSLTIGTQPFIALVFELEIFACFSGSKE